MNFWRFGNDPALFFNSLLILVVLFLALGQWKAVSSSLEAVETPLVEIRDFDFYVLSARGVSVVANVQSARHYPLRNELSGLIVERMQKKTKEKIVMPKVIEQKNEWTFSEGVAFNSERGLAFTSETGVYNRKTEVFQGEGEFLLRQGESSINGQNIYLGRSPEKIRGDDVRLILKEGDR